MFWGALLEAEEAFTFFGKLGGEKDILRILRICSTFHCGISGIEFRGDKF